LRVSVDFPAPEGEDRISRTPRRGVENWSDTRLLQILHLLAELIDHSLEVEADPREGHVV